ncbi:MAG: Hsp70 family protein, partial [Dethiobacteria bacterium]|nr:Hsp70 family protein [Dethiobacteria bacterium]
PPAPRGIPQVEVSFNIDANGIVNVSAKDLATNREQTITITASSGLEKDQINDMVNDAEEFAEEDRKRRDLAEARNQADSLAYSAEKSLIDLGDKVEADKAAEVTKAVEELRETVKGEDLEQIKAATEKMNSFMHELSSKLYEQAKAAQAGAEGEAGAAGEGAADADNVVDADFDVQDEEEKEVEKKEEAAE